MFEGGGVEDLAQLEAQLLLVKIADQELRQAGFVDGPVCVADCAFHGGVERLDVDTWFALRGLLERERSVEVGDAGEGQRARVGHVCVVGLDRRHLGGLRGGWERSMARGVDVVVAVAVAGELRAGRTRVMLAESGGEREDAQGRLRVLHRRVRPSDGSRRLSDH